MEYLCRTFAAFLIRLFIRKYKNTNLQVHVSHGFMEGEFKTSKLLSAQALKFVLSSEF